MDGTEDDVIFKHNGNDDKLNTGYVPADVPMREQF